MRTKALAELRENNHVRNWWISAPLPVAVFANRLVPFNVHGSVLEAAADSIDLAVDAFRAMVDPDGLLAAAVFEHYEACIRGMGAPRRFGSASELWSTLRPDSVAIAQDSETGIVHLLVNTECEWDEEHGLQLVFRLGTELVRISEQDGNIVDLPSGKNPFQVA
jgi:hypothetical protein